MSLLLALALSCAAPAQDAFTPYESGLRKLNQGDLDGAMADLDRSLKIDPNHAPALQARGSARRRKGDLDGALADYDRAIELDAGKAEYFRGRSLVRRQKRDLDGALADCDRALEIDPKSPTAFSSRGNVKKDKEDLDGALADYTRAIDLDPRSALAFSNRGEVREFKADFPGALADYGRALELNPRSPAVWMKRGFLLSALRRWPEALADLRKSCEMNPDDAYPRMGIWLIRAEQGERDAATRELAPFLDAWKSSKAEDWGTKVALFLTGSLAEEELLKAAQNPDPETTRWGRFSAYFYIGALRHVEGETAKAEAAFQACLSAGKPVWLGHSRVPLHLKAARKAP